MAKRQLSERALFRTLFFLLASICFVDDAHAVRILTSGFELNSLTVGVEIDHISYTGGPSISSSTVRSGAYSLRCYRASASYGSADFAIPSGIASNKIYARVYLYIATLPSSKVEIFTLDNGSNALIASVTLDNNGKIGAAYATGSGHNLIAGSGGALSTGQWYRLEFMVDYTNPSVNETIDVRVNGADYVNQTVTDQKTTLGNFGRIQIGPEDDLGNPATFDLYFDDFALNDTSATSGPVNENSWPGEGKVVVLRPNGAGEATQWTPDSGSNYARVNEVTPDDGTSYIYSNTLNNVDLYPCSASGIGSSDRVDVVQVGARYNNNVADNTTAFKLEIEKTSGGAKSLSSTNKPNSTTWKTNSWSGTTNVAADYPLTLYQDPDGINWSQPTLDTLRVGEILSAAGTNNIQVSSIWVSVEYTPPTAKLTGISFLTGTGVLHY